MTKKYIKDMEVEEVIARLQKREVIKCETNSYSSEIKLINGILVKFDSNGDTFITPNLNIKTSGYNYYFEETKSFKITETGLYKTRDGRKAFLSVVDNATSLANGIVEGVYDAYFWNLDGNLHDDEQSSFDLVSRWEE